MATPAAKDLPEYYEINKAHPCRSERHDLYAEATRLVSDRHAKYDLVDLVNWLLHRIDRLEKANAEARRALGGGE